MPARWSIGALVLGAVLGCLACGGPAAPDAAPWFCGMQGADHDDTLRLMQRRRGPRTAGAVRAVLESPRWRSCWGNAALLLGAAAPPGAEAALLTAIDRVAVQPESDLEADALLAGLGLTVRLSDDNARITTVVQALVERADPGWWHGRAAEKPDAMAADRRQQAEIRARAAVFGLAYSGTRAAAEALDALRADPPGPPTFEAAAPDVFAGAVRQNRRWYRQPPGAATR